jgi:hypothetical protein
MRFRVPLSTVVPCVACVLLVACAEPTETVTRMVPLGLGDTLAQVHLSHTMPPDAPQRSATVAFLDGPAIEYSSTWRKNSETGASVGLPQYGGTAYFRDVAVTVNHSLRASTDGETWQVHLVHPPVPPSTERFRETGPTVTFRRSFNGESNCFLIGFSSLCGSEFAFFFMDVNVKCITGGKFDVEAFHNGARVTSADADFKVVPRVPDGTVPAFRQVGNTNAYDNSCVHPHPDSSKNSVVCPSDGTGTPRKISERGCALTTMAMALQYFGVNTNVHALNSWLNDNGGYQGAGEIVFGKVNGMAKDSGKTVKYEPLSGVSRDQLRQLICTYGPQVIQVNSATQPMHFVIATGTTDDGSDVTIIDPAQKATLLSQAPYNGVIKNVRSMKRPAQVDTLDTGVIVRFHSPGEIVLTDPLGRRAGRTASGTVLSEIPNALFHDNVDISTLRDDGEFESPAPNAPKGIDIGGASAPNGDYSVEVTGTGRGTYELNILLIGALGRRSEANFTGIPITPGEVHRYAFTYNNLAAGLPGATIPLKGAFSGGGQSASSDEMLTYARPAERQTTLAAGTTHYPLLVFFSPGINAATFTADLNGVNVTSMFSVVPSGSQTVMVPLAVGRNVLKLSAKGVTPTGKAASDTDNLIFKVP